MPNAKRLRTIDAGECLQNYLPECITGLPPVVHGTSNEIRGNSFGNPISRSPTIQGVTPWVAKLTAGW